MSISDLQKKVFGVVSQVMEVPLQDINDQSSADTVETWDSMTQMALTLALQEEFKIKIPSNKAIELTNVKAILAVLKEHGHG